MTYPLLSFFEGLRLEDRRNGHASLTLDEYLACIEAMSRGFGVSQNGGLYQLCKLLWLKPYHSEETFRLLFEEHIDKPDTLHAGNTQHSGGSTQAKPDTQAAKKEERPETPAEKTPPPPTDKRPPTDSVREAEQALSDSVWWLSFTPEKEVEYGIRGAQHTDTAPTFQLHNRHADFSIRQVTQLISSVRTTGIDGPRNILDWPETIKTFAKQGFITDFVHRRSKITVPQLRLIIDSSSSMIAFHQWVGDIAGVVPQGQTTYFKNCPAAQLYRDPDYLYPDVEVSHFRGIKSENILIISDAGAARNTYNPTRIGDTTEFLMQLKRHNVVWLNPMPRHRWPGTTAEAIGTLVPMFDMSEMGFLKAFRTLETNG